MTLDRKWEKFRGGPAAASKDDVRVTLNPRGLIYLNAKAYGAIGQPTAVALYYNREDDAIAVEPGYPRFVENFPLVKRLNGYAVNAGSFCRHFGIQIPKTQRFLRPNMTNEGQLILSLRETITIGGITKRWRQKSSKGSND